tara:strand:+ start:244 stop:435 length:192 start_codon:yes stop_codon:yes gene_type:complete
MIKRCLSLVNAFQRTVVVATKTTVLVVKLDFIAAIHVDVVAIAFFHVSMISLQLRRNWRMKTV